MRAVAACLLALSVLAAQADEPAAVQTELDLVQAEIAAFKHLKAADIATRSNPFRVLAVDYIQALEPEVREGGPFSITDAEAWEEPDGPKVAFIHRIERDMRQWHPIFSLTFLETVVRQPSWGLYALTMGLEGRDAEDAINRRKRERVQELVQAGWHQTRAEREVARRVLQEAVRLDEVYCEVLEGSIVRTLVQSLSVDPISRRLSVVERVGDILVLISNRGSHRRLDERVREGGGSQTLPEAIHEIAGNVLARQDLDAALKQTRFGQLLDLFVILQNEASRDHLLLLFDDFDIYGKLLGEWRPLFDLTLNEKTVAFILVSLERDPEGELGFDVVDQLTEWIVEQLTLTSDGLQHERIVDVMLLLQQEYPTLLEEYIVRFYRDFHAFNPAGYETVIFHLVGILVSYAELDVFVQPDSTKRKAEEDDGRPPHEKVMETLRWYNASLGQVAHTLPEIDIDFVERQQRAVLEKIFTYLEQNLVESTPKAQRIRPRFIETLLQLVKRIAHVADPDEIEKRILVPFARARGFDENPMFFWSRRKVTDTMEIYLYELAVIVAIERGR